MSKPRTIEQVEKEIDALKAKIRENDARILELKAARVYVQSLQNMGGTGP